MLYKIFASALLLGSQLIAMGQEERKLPKNFAGPSLIFDGTNMSATTGIEYERRLFAGKHFMAGIRGNYIKKYRSGNADLQISGYASGFNNNYNISLAQLWGTGYFFTSSQKNCSGPFFSTALGLTHSVAKKRVKEVYNNEQYKNLLGGIEFGSGIQFPIGNATAFRGMFSVSFSGAQDNPDGKKSPFVLWSTKIAIGF